MDGVVDVWDHFYSQNEVTYSHKVGGAALSAVVVQGSIESGGRLLAVGDVKGTINVLEACTSLVQPHPNEKGAINVMFKREIKQEMNLEARERNLLRAKKQEGKKSETGEAAGGINDKIDEVLRKIDADFLVIIKETEDNEMK
mmetsp:Transcript_22489/g.45078  ORF Transcript_22489/g.45078 Transcript_22489/m.45078 type:complete len:143 (-) Transcript_22489:84-512(-)